ncbi:MAG: tRNA (adenosine(37)-N6)-dimethylallyltransferase MiaA [Lachnospiraceae bacterium]|nr:tRNA (adenosine(37)-N6)-dimethylallyltransferase MiaA [Lachnospiraceae bacterium]
MKRPLIILTGPTAVGKTELSIGLAKAVNGEIISADSIQVYKHMDIGSAKIMPEEMQGVKHYLVDELEPDEEFNIVKFKELSLKYMEEIYSKGKIPIIVGGTGFYIQGILYDIDFAQNDADKSYREELNELAKINGSEYIHDMLRKVDPVSADNIHFNNLKRVIRALEYYKQTGNRISEHNEEQRENESPYDFKYFVLNNDRDVLYSRIDKRVDIMIENGLIDEVKNLRDMGYSQNLVSMQGIGYKEIYSYISGEYSLDEAIELIKKNTRHFAKRQLTWFRREKNVTWVDYRDFNNKQDKMLEFMIKEVKNIG